MSISRSGFVRAACWLLLPATPFWTGRAAAQSTSDPGGVAGEAVFDSVWSRIGSTHFDPDMGGLDWDGIREELRPRAAEAETPDALRSVLAEMLARLGQSHFAVIPSASAGAFAEAGPPSEAGTADPGIELRWIEEALVVTKVREGSSAERSGVRPGWIVDEIGGTAVSEVADQLRAGAGPGVRELRLELWVPAAAGRSLRGPEGSNVELSVRDANNSPRSIELQRSSPAGEFVRLGNLPPVSMETAYWTQLLPDGGTVGVIRFTAWFPTVVPAIAEAMDALRDSDAIILDLRGNPGGLGGLAMGVGGHFFDDRVSLGTMRTRGGALEFVVNPQTVTADGRRVQPYGGPLVILTDPLTASTSEIFAGGLQALGRATVIGEATAGQALPAALATLPNGDLLLHAVADFSTPDGIRLEGQGVRPDVTIHPRREAFLVESDPLLMEAIQWLRSR